MHIMNNGAWKQGVYQKEAGTGLRVRSGAWESPWPRTELPSVELSAEQA